MRSMNYYVNEIPLMFTCNKKKNTRENINTLKTCNQHALKMNLIALLFSLSSGIQMYLLLHLIAKLTTHSTLFGGMKE